jgi:hypothetical protein
VPVVPLLDYPAVREPARNSGGYGFVNAPLRHGVDPPAEIEWSQRPGAHEVGQRRGCQPPLTRYEAIPAAEQLYGNITIGGGSAPARAYIDDLLPDVLDGRIDPGRVFDRVIGLDEVPDGYRAMNEREAIKLVVNPS